MFGPISWARMGVEGKDREANKTVVIPLRL
jgi:hypothetical protein